METSASNDKCKSPVPIWVINLQRDIERRRFMEGQLAKLPCNYEIIEGVDGSRLGPEDKKLYSRRKTLSYIGRELAAGEIGCMLSHIHVWKRIIKDDIEKVVVLEDDVLINPDFFKVLEELSHCDISYNFINFLTDVPQEPFGSFLYKDYRLARHYAQANRACSYLITNEGAKKLLKKAIPIFLAADGLTGRTNLTGLISYGVNPALFSLSEFESSIWRETTIPPTSKTLSYRLRNFFGRRWRHTSPFAKKRDHPKE